jgi:general secretion pathway protein C
MANKYFIIINVLLITVGVYFSVNAFYSLTTAWLKQRGPIQSVAPAKVSFAENEKQPQLLSYRAITERNLFNTKTDGVSKPKPIDVEQLKKTELQLKLWGTVIGKERQAYAVIEDANSRQQNLYRIGDTIQSATVKLILREKVVLKVDERDEVLAMEETRTAKGRESRSLARKETSPPRIPVSSYQRKLTLKSEQIESALENLDQLMSQARIKPHLENGQAAGISITGIKPNTIFRKMRLRNGDIITSVNGTPIESVDDAIKIFGDLSSASEVQLEIKRRGKQKVLNYQIE